METAVTTSAALVRLDCTVRSYAWGSRTVLAELLGRVPGDEPQAELWVGAHPDAPARLLGDGRTLPEYIAGDAGAALGPGAGERLPFLLKVLAVEHPLSLQVHPDERQARAGFARENAAGLAPDASDRNYRDDSAKPELVCALTTFDALCGLREPREAAGLVAALGVPALDGVVAALTAGDAKRAVETLLTWPAGERRALVEDVRKACAGLGDDPYRVVERLADLHPDDTGPVTSLLMNLVRLEPGEALNVPPRTLHAYLRGTAVEILASSDNVLRGGLTPKHVDVAEVLAVADFGAFDPVPLKAEPAPNGEGVFPSPAAGFRLTRCVPGAARIVLDRPGPSALLCLDGAVSVARDGRTERLRRGEALFVPFRGGPVELTGEGEVFRATVA
ncbi:mannose-6-phosphate isomerase, class I [Actinomadura logoneensis]|uniref:mannose-6-phosphate isomerase, class I n=1 Tax=Actinomadura logoneensis TaxID=2293572 RepID=UPI0018F2705C|nr:mannose-6-phosphate isomerase, class I [Actinomadura logoneensis]